MKYFIAVFAAIALIGCLDDKGIPPSPDAEARSDAPVSSDNGVDDASVSADADALDDSYPRGEKEYTPGNPKCEDFGLVGLKVDPVKSGIYEEHGRKVKITTNGYYVNWTASFFVSTVIAKAGNGAFLWQYKSPVWFDLGMYGPTNKHGRHHKLSHITFCTYALPQS